MNRFYCFGAVLVLIVVAGVSCEQTSRKRVGVAQSAPVAQISDTDTPAPPAPPASSPLLLEDKPLLLSDEPSVDSESTPPVADNSRCQVCHLNLVQEALALTHAKANIGCAECHGASDDHIADESWASGGNGTAPDKMYLPAQINPSCLNCHPKEKVDESTHQAFFAGTTKEKNCAQCHGQHRLIQRKCKWK